MGPVQIENREKREIEALVAAKIEAYCNNDDHEYHSCEISRHEHPPLPMIKGSYG